MFFFLFFFFIFNCDLLRFRFSLFDANFLNAFAAHPAEIYLAAPHLLLLSLPSLPTYLPTLPGPPEEGLPFSGGGALLETSVTPKLPDTFFIVLCASVLRLLFFYLSSCLFVSLFACFCLSVGFLEYKCARTHTRTQIKQQQLQCTWLDSPPQADQLN